MVDRDNTRDRDPSRNVEKPATSVELEDAYRRAQEVLKGLEPYSSIYGLSEVDGIPSIRSAFLDVIGGDEGGGTEVAVTDTRVVEGVSYTKHLFISLASTGEYVGKVSHDAKSDPEDDFEHVVRRAIDEMRDRNQADDPQAGYDLERLEEALQEAQQRAVEAQKARIRGELDFTLEAARRLIGVNETTTYRDLPKLRAVGSSELAAMTNWITGMDSV